MAPMPLKPARGRRKAGSESGREALLRAALICFGRHGYESTTLRAIAAEAGVDMALVGRLFGSKAVLWEAMIARLASDQERWEATLRPIAAQVAQAPREAGAALITLFVDICLGNPAFTAFLLQEIGSPGERLTVILARLVQPFRDRFRPVVKACMAAGVIGGTDPDLVIGMIISAASPLAYPEAALAQDALRDRLVAEALALFLRAAMSDR